MNVDPFGWRLNVFMGVLLGIAVLLGTIAIGLALLAVAAALS